MGMNDRHKTIELGLRCPDVSKSADIVFSLSCPVGLSGLHKTRKVVQLHR